VIAAINFDPSMYFLLDDTVVDDTFPCSNLAKDLNHAVLIVGYD